MASLPRSALSHADGKFPRAPFFSAAVCAESIDGIACGLCLFASGIVLEFVYVLWYCSMVVDDIVVEQLSLTTALYLMLYTIAPYTFMLVTRLYTLSKSQAFRRSLRRRKIARKKFNEKSNLLSP